jgi:hypothetical protein
MGLRIVVEDGLHCPKVLCDTCGLEIADCQKGNVCYPDGGGQPVFVHKGTCDRSQPRDKQYPWMELRHFMVYLENNLGFKGKVARRAVEDARDMAGL